MAHTDRTVRLTLEGEMAERTVRLVDQDGNPVTFPDGATFVVLAPDTPTRNTIQPADDSFPGLIVTEHSPTQTEDLLQVATTGVNYHSDITCRQGANAYFRVTNPNQDVALLIRLTGIADTPGIVVAGFQGGTSDLVRFQTVDATLSFLPDRWVLDSSANPVWSKADSANDLAEVGRIEGGFQSNTAGATKGRMTFKATDSSGDREGIRIEADGSAPRIGFLGAAAAVRQTGGAATANTSTYGSNEAGMLQKVYDMARTFGLLT